MTEPSRAELLSYASQDTEAARRICEAMRAALVLIVLSLSLLGCATRPVNPKLTNYQVSAETQLEMLERNRGKHEDIVVLAFSGGGIFIRGFGSAATHRNCQQLWQQGPSAR